MNLYQMVMQHYNVQKYLEKCMQYASANAMSGARPTHNSSPHTANYWTDQVLSRLPTNQTSGEPNNPFVPQEIKTGESPKRFG